MSLSLQKDQRNNLLYITFNQDHGCFACGTDGGFQIWNCDPLKERFKRDMEGGIGIVEMLFRCNILALVGGGRNPKYPPNKVMIWDDYQSKCLAELEFRSEVKGVKLRRDRIVVALENKVYVYNFSDLQLILNKETTSNPKGLIALSPDTSNVVMAFPGLKPGHVRIFNNSAESSIQAHQNALSYIALSLDGTRLATSSEQGTVIRVWDTATGEKVAELRRGKDKAEINSITFSKDGRWLSVSSDKGTIHVFGLNNNPSNPAPVSQDEASKKTQKSSFNFLSGYLPTSLNDYVTSDFSFAQIHLSVPRSICAFTENADVIVVGADGTFYRFSFDKETGGEGKQEANRLFLTAGAGDD